MSSASSLSPIPSVYTDFEPGRVFWGALRKYRWRARKTVRPEPPMSTSMEARIAEHAAPTPPLPVASSPLPLPSHSLIAILMQGNLGYRAAGSDESCAASQTSTFNILPPGLMFPRLRCLLEESLFTYSRSGLRIGGGGGVGGESSAAGAARQPGPTPEVDTWDEIVEAMMEIAPTTLEGVDQRVTELDTTVRQRTEEFQVLRRRSAALEAHVRTLEAQVATLIAQTTSLQTQLTYSAWDVYC
ncbi:hypothetical protein Tco_1509285 [Tanacetum coccineum]